MHCKIYIEQTFLKSRRCIRSSAMLKWNTMPPRAEYNSQSTLCSAPYLPVSVFQADKACVSGTRQTHRTHQQRSEGSVITQQVNNGWDHGFPDLNAEILNPLSRVKMCFVTVTCVHQGSDLQHSWVSPESAPATHLLLNSFWTSFWERRLSVTVIGNLTNYIINHIPSPILQSGRICF